MREQAEDGPPEGGAHLDDKLHLIIGGVTGRDEGGVQGAAEGGQGVHGLLVVESEDGVDPAGELGANCRDSRGQEDSVKISQQIMCMHIHECVLHHFGQRWIDWVFWPNTNKQLRVYVTLSIHSAVDEALTASCV